MCLLTQFGTCLPRYSENLLKFIYSEKATNYLTGSIGQIIGGDLAKFCGLSEYMNFKIGVTNLPKPGWAIAHPAHSSPTPLHAPYKNDFVLQLSHNMKNKKSC